MSKSYSFSYSVERECAASFYVTISGEKISSYEEAEEICKMVENEIGCKCEVALGDCSLAEDGEAADDDACYVTYSITCEWSERVNVYKGAGTYDDYDDVEGSEDPAGDMLYDIRSIFENQGYRVIDSFVTDENCESLEDIAEQFANDNDYDDDYDDYWDEYDPYEAQERDSREYDYGDL